MNETYLFTSANFKGDVVFEFDESGLLVRYDITTAQLSEEQKVFILQKLPRSIKTIQEVLGKSKTAKLTKQAKTAASFEDFWNRYDEKTRSSKKKTQTIWNRMSQVQRDKAFNFIPTYFRNIPNGIARMYANSYLNAELWNN